MKKIVKTTVLAVACIFAATTMNAQSFDAKKHEIRPFYGTSTGFDDVDNFADSFTDGLLGIAKKANTTSFGLAGLGYRYHMNRFGLGLDLAYSTAKKEKFKNETDTKPSETINMTRYFLMPTASFSYYSNDYVDIYGAASAGALYEITKKDVKDAKEEKVTRFAYQVTPVGLRVGTQSIGAFVELGYGHKGILNAGLSLKF